MVPCAASPCPVGSQTQPGPILKSPLPYRPELDGQEGQGPPPPQVHGRPCVLTASPFLSMTLAVLTLTSATGAPVVSSQAASQSTKERDKGRSYLNPGFSYLLESTTPDDLPHPADFQQFPIILPLPGSSVDQLCVDVHSREGMKLFEDPEQGLQVFGDYENGGFSSIKVNIQEPHLHIHATPERLVMRRDRKSSEYKWKQTLFVVLPGLKITMDKMGLLQLSGADRVGIALVPMNEPQKGLMLQVQDTQHFSNRTDGDLGRFYQDIVWDPPVGPDDTTRTLRVQGTEYSATRQLKRKYQGGSKGTDISCWTVKI